MITIFGLVTIFRRVSCLLGSVFKGLYFIVVWGVFEDFQNGCVFTMFYKWAVTVWYQS